MIDCKVHGEIKIGKDPSELYPYLTFEVIIENRDSNELIIPYILVPRLHLTTVTNSQIGVINGNTVIDDDNLDNYEKYSFIFPLSHETIKIIEERREGKSIKYLLNIEIFGIRTRKDFDKPLQLNKDKTIRMFKRMGTSTGDTIAVEIWNDYLKELGYPYMSIIHLHLPKIKKHDELKKNIERLEEANTQFQNGDYTASVVSCRKVIEFLIKITENNEPLKKIINHDSVKDGNFDEKDKRYRGMVENILEDVKNVTHTGAHGSYAIFREDANLVLIQTTTLLSYYSKKLTDLEDAK